MLLTNANLLMDGHAKLQGSYDVLIKDDRIVSISPASASHHNPNAIDLGGRTLMPGLIDAHAHITGLSLSPRNISYPASEIAVAAANYLHSSCIVHFHLLSVGFSQLA